MGLPLFGDMGRGALRRWIFMCAASQALPGQATVSRREGDRMNRRSLLLSCPRSCCPACAARSSPASTVFAAASLTDVLGDIGKLWEAAGHAQLRTSFASSSTLARQIEQGAPAEVFASADEQWADYLQQRGLLVPGTRGTC